MNDEPISVVEFAIKSDRESMKIRRIATNYSPGIGEAKLSLSRLT